MNGSSKISLCEDVMATSTIKKPKQLRILGIPVSLVDLPTATETTTAWAGQSGPRVVFVREVASLMAAVKNDYLATLHEKADLIVADGMPLVWIARLRGHGREIGRSAGADLVDAVCVRSLRQGLGHYFYGGKPGVAEKMAAELRKRHPGLKVVGTYSPPMRAIGPDYELDADALQEISNIKKSKPHFIWVGISSPKQEYWMMKAAPIISEGVFFGVGAAFDFHSGEVRRAPAWMRAYGFEWLHRLISEPRRLWRRYLLLAPQFLLAVGIEQMKISFAKYKITRSTN